MKTITVNLYSFNELDDKAKKRVLSNLSDINVEDDWYKYEIDDYVLRLEHRGYKNADIRFSGFGSQGDGASFTTDEIDLVALCKTLNIELTPSFTDWLKVEDITLLIERYTRHYCHPNTVRAEWRNVGDIPPQFDNLLCEIEDKITADVRSQSKVIYHGLSEVYDSLTSDEAIIETINANGYTFEVDGTLHNE